MAKSYSLSKYRKEANISPFVLEVDDDTNIIIQPPDGDTMLELGNVQMHEGRRMLRLVCGDKFDEVMEVLGGEPAPILASVAMDMIKHFGLAEVQGIPGGSRALPR